MRSLRAANATRHHLVTKHSFSGRKSSSRHAHTVFNARNMQGLVCRAALYDEDHPNNWRINDVRGNCQSWCGKRERQLDVTSSQQRSCNDGEIDVYNDSHTAARWQRDHADASRLQQQHATESRARDALHTVPRKPDQVFVILFGMNAQSVEGQNASVAPQPVEGIYSLRELATPTDELPREIILAFEDEDDAQRYACLLEASMTHNPEVIGITPGELLEFCTDMGYSLRLEKPGTLLVPPAFNMSMTDWERSLRLRWGKFDVLEADTTLMSDQRRVMEYFSEDDEVFDATLNDPAALIAEAERLNGIPSSSEQLMGAAHAGDSQLNEARVALERCWSNNSMQLELNSLRAQLESLLPKDGDHQ